MVMKSVLVWKVVNIMVCIGCIDLRYMKLKIVFFWDISLKYNVKGIIYINVMKLKYKFIFEFKYGENIFIEMKIIEMFININKYLNESVEKLKFFYFSNVVG